MGTSISSDIGDPELPLPIWITEMGTSSDQPTSYTSFNIGDPEPPLPNWITEMGTSSDQPTSYTSVYIGDPEPPLSNWITDMGTSSHQPTSYTSVYIVDPEPPLPNWITEMGTSSHQPTSYTSFNIGDPEPPLPNWITEMGTSSDQPTSYTSFNIGDPEPPLPNRIKEMGTSSDQSRDHEPPLANLITEVQQGLHRISKDHVSIYRVPLDLREANEEAFTPQMVSIGPFHHGKAKLQPWEETKLRYLQPFLDRTKKTLEDCIEFVKGLEGRARACYRDKIDMSSNAFVKMMLVDSCFIIEAILRYGNNYPELQEDYLSNPELILRFPELAEDYLSNPELILRYGNNYPELAKDYLSNPELISLVRRDMILLENQIPFFVLHRLFRLGFSNIGEHKFLELTISYFSYLVSTITEDGDEERVFRDVKSYLESGIEIEHFTDLLRICHRPPDFKKPNMAGSIQIPNASSLHEAGMKFKFGTSKCLVEMNYNNGFLEMPKFIVHGHLEFLLKNLIALETCHYPYESYIIDYIFFMDMLIDTAADADLLHQMGIITHYMRDNAEVASIFNNVGKGATLFGSSYYKSIADDLNKYYKARWHKWKATFKRDYCSTPWKIASALAAIILLVLTLIQTIWTIM